MTPPSNCPYKELTAKPCWNCPQYMPDVDQCKLNPFTAAQASNGNVASAQTYAERLRQYEEDRRKLLELSKETLVDLIIHRPTMY
jgi:uncharacterized protein YjiS (DUF1127 family)